MVAYLKKPKGSEGFHQIVDFLNGSHIRYALTENPTIYVSLIKQFWKTATARTLDNREIELTATIDGKIKIGEGSKHPVESNYTPTSAPSTSQPPISPTSRRTTRQESMAPQPRSPTQTSVVDEAASTCVDVKETGELVHRAYQSEKEHIGGHTLQQLRGYSFDEIKTLFETTMRRVNTFVLIESEVDKVVPELAARSSKKVAEEELDQESSKRQKTGESSELAEEPRDKEADELSQEELQQMMIIVLEQGNGYFK
ncbi:hypothetical protein Tco_0849848 [Tanacetum coccineum]